MKKGYLSQYFEGVAAKTLSQVEANMRVSHQHEFNGIKEMCNFLGRPADKVVYQAQFMYFTDFGDEPIIEEGELSWYDSRKNQPLRSAEYRLYFTVNTVMQMANPGDTLIVAKIRGEMKLLVIVAEQGTTITSQLLWLFGFFDGALPGFSVREEMETEQDRIAFASRVILENIGIEVEVNEENYLDEMLRFFHGVFPTTKESAEYTRSTLGAIDYTADHDSVLMACYEREDILFRTLERHIVGERLQKGFADVDDFFAFSKSAQNRRKSRAGLALENHFEYILKQNEIRYSHTPETERKAKPDFIFPGITEYRDPAFPAVSLAMLGVKTTCKDRWRQVLTEADRIPHKHLLTLEAAISVNQTDEMKGQNLQLVVPKKIQPTYRSEQQSWLLTVGDFISLVKTRQ
jgi:hypothetical protein